MIADAAAGENRERKPISPLKSCGENHELFFGPLAAGQTDQRAAVPTALQLRTRPGEVPQKDHTQRS
ncbi:hypothetical protein P3T40_008899 [Paraburkholderia sp. EB58]|jgi:hypothetical protein|uniref:hypothetical protein n=1 Tax=Paraburkholderia sp. EB58 TaxID=3035125 RepID=UPI003D1D9AED